MCVSKKIYMRVVNASRKAKGRVIVLRGSVSFCGRKSWQSDRLIRTAAAAYTRPEGAELCTGMNSKPHDILYILQLL